MSPLQPTGRHTNKLGGSHSGTWAWMVLNAQFLIAFCCRGVTKKMRLQALSPATGAKTALQNQAEQDVTDLFSAGADPKSKALDGPAVKIGVPKRLGWRPLWARLFN